MFFLRPPKHPHIRFLPSTRTGFLFLTVTAFDARTNLISFLLLSLFCAFPPSIFSQIWSYTRFCAFPSRVRMSSQVCNGSINSPSLSLSITGPIQNFLFDIDGTLCDSDPLHFEAFRELLLEVGYQDGVPIDEEFFIKYISGKHNEDIAHSLFPDWDHQKALQFMDDKEVLFRRFAKEKLVPVKGLQKLCKWIEEKGFRRAAVTNAPRLNAELMISILGLSEFFEYLIIGGECEHAKPYPDPYLKGLQCLGASPDRALVFEDSVSGIKAAISAGIPVVGITTRNPENLLLDDGASFLIKDFEDPKLWSVLEGEAVTGGEFS